jgi:hypothetical protein
MTTGEQTTSTTDKPIPRAEQVGSLKRSPRLVAANEAVYAPGHVAIEAHERAHGMDELYAIAAGRRGKR